MTESVRMQEALNDFYFRVVGGHGYPTAIVRASFAAGWAARTPSDELRAAAQVEALRGALDELRTTGNEIAGLASIDTQRESDIYVRFVHSRVAAAVLLSRTAPDSGESNGA